MTQSPVTPYDGFLTVLAPQIDAARARLGAGMAALPAGGPALPDAPALVEMMFDGVRGHLERMVTPTLALELNVARLQGQLAGDTPEARYESYVRQLAEAPVAEALRAEYPALFALAAERLDLWVSVSLELLGRLAADWPEIRATLFDGRDPGALAGLRYPQRSTKRVGRAVVLMRFEGGDRLVGDRLVYKPRSLAVESRFHDLLAWLNGAGFAPEFRPVALLDRDTHGWMAWVNAAEATTTTEIERFYRRQGAYLALFYALEATDLHMSNVIAAGEHPALIDLETLFHPREADMDWPPLDLELDDMIYYSVLRPGLLPEPETAEEGDPDRLDLSGLAGAGGQTTPYEVPVWRGKGTDAMRLEQARKTISGSKNQPMLDGQPADVLDYLDALEGGFVDAYRLLMARRDELMAGPLAAFEGVEVRVMPRSGRRYGDILESSYHPDLLRDPAKRPLYLAAMLRDDADDESDPLRLIDHELADMLAGDTPIFTTQAGSADITDSRGRVLSRFFVRSGLDAARLRVAELDERDLARQRWIVRASLATVADEQPAERRELAVPDAPPPDLAQRALNAARAIGERLAEWAVRLDDEVSWIGLEQDEYGYWSIEPMGDELGHGLTGAVAFLSALGEATGDDAPGELVGGALATLLRHGAEDGEEDAFDDGEYDEDDDDYDDDEEEDDYDDEDDDDYDEDDYDEPLGLFDGVGGRLYVLAGLHAARPNPAIAAEMERLIALAADLLNNPVEEEQGGLARGAAGALLGLLAAHRALPGSGALDAARAAGGLLASGELLFEDPEGPPAGPLATFYDGPLGAVGPLLALAEASGDKRYLKAAERLAVGLADAAANATAATDPGLWLAYLAARPWLGNSARRTLDGALREALPGILSQGIGRDHSLVYGDLGLVDLALRAAAALDDSALAERYGAAVLDDIERRGPVAATPLAVETPGWAAGLAGIGYGLLRLAAPERVTPLPTFGPAEGAR